MPITSPSYFPPARGNGSVIGTTAGKLAIGANDFLGGTSAGANSTANNLICIGLNAGAGGITDAVNLSGSIIIGANSAQLLSAGAQAFPLTVLGSNNVNGTTGIDSTVVIGSSIMNASATYLTQSVLIGTKLFNRAVTSPSTISAIMIGFDILSSATNNTGLGTSVLLGTQMLQSAGANARVNNSIVMGDSVANSMTGLMNSSVVIGASADTVANPTGNVIIGSQAGQTGGAATDSNNVVIGTSAGTTGNLNVALGKGAKTSALAGNIGTVCIGANAGTTFAGTETNTLVIESSTTVGGGGGNTPSTLAFGNFLSGNLILNNSVQGTNRDFGGVPGTNMLKLVNGTKATGANVIGGGYFYVSAGALHWVGSAGTDTTLATA
jgi:hypothetical protein